MVDENGDPVLFLAGTSSVSQIGSAPAILIDGNGTPISIGLVAQITDPTDPDFDETLQYGFINEGTAVANGLFDDFNATTLSFAEVEIEGGVSNSGSLSATTFRAANATSLTDGDGIARVIVFGDQAIAEEINNSGAIVASSSEAIDEIFFDRTNIIAPRSLLAVAIDIGEGASVSELVNTGAISSLLVGREGTAIAVRDRSGTLTRIDNSGFITTAGRNIRLSRTRGDRI